MFELYYKPDGDNTTSSRLCCEIFDEDNKFIIDFLMFERSDFNKWSKPKVLTDLIVTRLTLPTMIYDISSKEKLKSYIKANFDENLDFIEAIEKIAESKNHIAISLPTTMYPHRRGIPTGARPVKDTFFPLIVTIDGQDVSNCFMDFYEFEDKAVDTVYQALFKGNMPKSKKDIFCTKGVEELHHKLKNQEMGN